MATVDLAANWFPLGKHRNKARKRRPKQRQQSEQAPVSWQDLFPKKTKPDQDQVESAEPDPESPPPPPKRPRLAVQTVNWKAEQLKEVREQVRAAQFRDAVPAGPYNRCGEPRYWS